MLFLAFRPLLTYIFATFLYRHLQLCDSGWFTSIPKWLRNEIGMSQPAYFFWQGMLSVFQIQRVRNEWGIRREMVLLFGEPDLGWCESLSKVAKGKLFHRVFNNQCCLIAAAMYNICTCLFFKSKHVLCYYLWF